ncbi:PIN domain-containing protein [Corticibacterium sp. UT-5YL-CI-8]|nr:PIN domain-containing protein [Tianweitania sp. UT-5YL-CI-8]
MIGVDTNILLRLLVDDDPEQCAKSRAFFARRTARSPAFVSAVSLVELLWLLKRRLHYDGDNILAAVRTMTQSAEFRFEHGEKLRSFLERADITASDLPDALVAWSCEAAKCDTVVTFDKRSARLLSSMELLS